MVFAKVAANVPVPVPVTSPVNVIVWFPVFVPDKFEPVTVPVAATDVGVIAPSVNVIAGVVVELATVPETPFAEVTDTEVTEPPPPPPPLTVAQVAEVPSVVKNFPVLPVWVGSNALIAADCVICPVPPLLIGTVASVVTNDPVPEPVTAPVNVIV